MKMKSKCLKIAMISDAAYPTNSEYPGHGLGQAVLNLSNILLGNGHDVTLFAAEGSKFDGKLITPVSSEHNYYNEKKLAQAVITKNDSDRFDIIIDNTHTHILSQYMRMTPTLNIIHDIWQTTSVPRPILLTEGQKTLMPSWTWNAPVITHAINDLPFSPKRDEDDPYVLFLGIIHYYKGIDIAISASAIASLKYRELYGKPLKLKVVGTMPNNSNNIFSNTGNTEYLGAKTGDEKIRLIQGATALLQLGGLESCGLTTMEAGLCGTPTVAYARGGSVDLIKHNVNGLFIPMDRHFEKAAADMIIRSIDMSREACREYAYNHFTDMDKMVDKYMDVIARAMGRELW